MWPDEQAIDYTIIQDIIKLMFLQQDMQRSLTLDIMKVLVSVALALLERKIMAVDVGEMTTLVQVVGKSSGILTLSYYWLLSHVVRKTLKMYENIRDAYD